MVKSGISKKRPKVSVVIPMYNAADTIAVCLQSILSQDYPPHEVIIVDDGSKDESPAIAKRMGAKVFFQERNQGPALARNRCVKEASGDIVFLVDSDTAMLPGTISRMVKTISTPGVDAVAGRYAKESLNRGFVPQYYCLLKHFSKRFDGIEDHCVFCGECIASWRSAFLEAGGYRAIPFGVDVENEEFGRRFIKGHRIVIDSAIQVRHHFPYLKKLARLFYSRTYWWVRFYFVHRSFEKALTTKSFAAGNIAAFMIVPAAVFSVWAGVAGMAPGILYAAVCVLLVSILLWAKAYAGFLRFVAAEKGALFACVSAVLSVILAWPVTLGAVHGLLDHVKKGVPEF